MSPSSFTGRWNTSLTSTICRLRSASHRALAASRTVAALGETLHIQNPSLPVKSDDFFASFTAARDSKKLVTTAFTECKLSLLQGATIETAPLELKNWRRVLTLRDLRDVNVEDPDIRHGFVRLVHASALDTRHRVLALLDTAKDRVFIIQPWRRHGRDEKLGFISARTSVGHRQRKRPIMSQVAMKFIFEFASPNGFAACAIAQWISGLNHKVLDHTMEQEIVVVPIPCMGTKIFHRLWTLFPE
ncbi:hypothetical protein PsorP6_012075 [Peronosclerospora sorghi]|uniref:Uncharacterized protein n=1 Tax=Peronosclerospora sorghi TaxID=230839 RepID=A0ACC0WHX2_9STRA|nr:hypothetical protein PsorP6_012075 [Peronosclerospora sorghi]